MVLTSVKIRTWREEANKVSKVEVTVLGPPPPLL
jgi:hypothetical protein